MYCKNTTSHVCLRQCRDRVCSKTPIIRIILSSGDRKRISFLYEVMSIFELKVSDYT